MNKYKRVFTIVIDSLGVGSMNDSALYNDYNVNTLGHIAKYCNGMNIPNLRKLGLANLQYLKGVDFCDRVEGYYTKASELSLGKDTLTGHYELMGLVSEKPYQTFTETGFPQELISLLEEKCGHKIIGNKAASGTEIINELGKEHIETKAMIVYTSADSVLQIAAHEEYFGLEELYRCCEIAREITKAEKWKVARVIARPFVSEGDTFVRTSNRHDYALNPPAVTLLDDLKKASLDVIGIGKINDIFNGCGISEYEKSKSSHEGMIQALSYLDKDFHGLCFVNLVDFDALWGHRRNPIGYKEQLEDFDTQLGMFIDKMKEDDLLIVCADHGNDPTYVGSDHTREYIPLLFYNKTWKGSGLLPMSKGFTSVAATIAENFDIPNYDIHNSYLSYFQ